MRTLVVSSVVMLALIACLPAGLAKPLPLDPPICINDLKVEQGSDCGNGDLRLPEADPCNTGGRSYRGSPVGFSIGLADCSHPIVTFTS